VIEQLRLKGRIVVIGISLDILGEQVELPFPLNGDLPALRKKRYWNKKTRACYVRKYTAPEL
jgi:hypothetical protein